MAIRKNPKADLRKTYGVVVEIGMIAALLLLILAFRVNLDRGETMEFQQIIPSELFVKIQIERGCCMLVRNTECLFL